VVGVRVCNAAGGKARVVAGTAPCRACFRGRQEPVPCRKASAGERPGGRCNGQPKRQQTRESAYSGSLPNVRCQRWVCPVGVHCQKREVWDRSDPRLKREVGNVSANQNRNTGRGGREQVECKPDIVVQARCESVGAHMASGQCGEEPVSQPCGAHEGRHVWCGVWRGGRGKGNVCSVCVMCVSGKRKK